MRNYALAKLCALGLYTSLSLSAWAASVGTVTHLAGVLSTHRDSGQVKILGVNSEIESGDLLATSTGTYARIKFSDGGELTLRPNSQLKIDDYRFSQDKPENDNAFFSLLKGGLRAVTGLVGRRNGLSSYRMNTPTATIGIRGTDYGALFCNNDCSAYKDNAGQVPQNGAHFDVRSGIIEVSNPAGSTQIAAGGFGYAGPNILPVLVPPSAGVPLSLDQGSNKPPEAVLGKPVERKDFECTVE